MKLLTEVDWDDFDCTEQAREVLDRIIGEVGVDGWERRRSRRPGSRRSTPRSSRLSTTPPVNATDANGNMEGYNG